MSGFWKKKGQHCRVCGFYGLCRFNEAAPSEKGPNFVMLSPSVGLLPAGHGFQRGDWLLVTFPPTGTPGISVTSRGDVSVEAEVVTITSPPGQGILVRMVGELGKNAGPDLKGYKRKTTFWFAAKYSWNQMNQLTNCHVAHSGSFVHCSWIIFKIFRIFKKTVVSVLCLHAFASARGEVQQKNLSRGSGGKPCDLGSSAECAGHLATCSAETWDLLAQMSGCLRFCCAVLCPKTMKKKAKKGRKAKVKGRKRRDPVLQYGWRTEFSKSVFNFLYDRVLKDLCSRASFMSAWFGGCAAGRGQQLKWDRARFGSCGISRCWNFSPLALGQGTSQSHAVSVMSCDDWMIGCYDERHSERLWKTLQKTPCWHFQLFVSFACAFLSSGSFLS